MEATSGPNSTPNDDRADGYADFLATLQERSATARGPLFRTDASGLFEAFLEALPPESRQHYTCQACRRFVERYGALVEITPRGGLRAVLWDGERAPDFFRPAVRELERRVTLAKVTGVCCSSEGVWGLRENTSRRTGRVWRHMAVKPPESLVFKDHVLKNATQAEAEKLEEHAMLRRGLEEFPLDTAIRAMTLLKGGNLYRSEKADAVARWFVEVHEARQAAKGGPRENLTWLAVATAPAGFAHIKSSMIGTLLEDLQAGLPFADIKRKWDQKMHPLQYLRPQAAPTAGNLAEAEKVVAALKSAGALERRYARLEDVEALWRPAPGGEPRAAGVFGHLQPKGTKAPRVEQPPVTMTFEKFRREVLPQAVQLAALVPAHGNFVAMVTTVNPDAPPILQWDHEAHRNPVNWYVWPGGSPASQWGLAPGWVEVTAIALMPPMWNAAKDHGHHGRGAFVLLKGCRDTREGGIALFPEVLKAEYRPIRATIEAFSRSAQLKDRDQATACGLDLRAGQAWQQQVRATDARHVQTVYLLDRWD